MRGTPLLALAAPFLAACGDLLPRGVAPGHLVLVPAPPVSPVSPVSPGPTVTEPEGIPPEEVVARLVPPAELTPWEVSGAGGHDLLRRSEASAPTLIVRSDGEPMRIAVPGPFEPASFDRVACRILGEGQGALGVNLLAAGERVLRSAEARLVSPSREPESLVFDFPGVQALAEPIEAIELVFVGRKATLGLEAVELLDRPLARWIADTDEEPALIAVGEDARRGWVLTTTRPLTVEVTVPPGKYELVYAFAWPDVVRSAGQQPELEILAAYVDSVRDHRVMQRTFLSETSGWQRRDFSRAVENTARLRFTFTLVEPSGLEAACAIADVELRLREPEAEPEQRTVLLVTSDTHRADYLGAARRGVEVRTPALDALAAEGVLFEDCWSSTNITNPSHIALMTGVSPRDTRVVTNTVPLADGARTLAEEFRRVGFVTWAVLSVTNLGDTGSGLGQGFDRVATPPVAPVGDAGEAVDRVLAWLPEAEGRPLFLWVHVFDAHTPYAPPPSHDRMYYPKESDPFDAARGAQPVPDELLPPFLRGLRDPAYPEAQYRAEVSYLDSELGRLLAAPRFANAVVAVTADHGESLGEHDTYFDHVTLYPDTLHVPLVLRAPKVPRGRRVADPVRQIDLGRTLLDLAGLARAEFPGRNLLAALEGSPVAEPRFALAAQGNAASLERDGSYLILHLVEHREHQSLRSFRRHQVELYDLTADPGCERDLVDEELARARALRAELVHWLKGFDAEGLAGNSSADGESLRELAGLGYLSHGSTLESSGWFREDDCDACARFAE